MVFFFDGFVSNADTTAFYHGFGQDFIGGKVEVGKYLLQVNRNSCLCVFHRIHGGKGIGYKYAHDYQDHYVDQQYLPSEIEGSHFYEPGDLGYEKTIKEYLQKIKGRTD